MTTQQELSEWFDIGKEAGATHMIVVRDTYSWEDYPVYVPAPQDPRGVANQYADKDMQKVMEVYNLSLPKAEQVNTTERVWNF